MKKKRRSLGGWDPNLGITPSPDYAELQQKGTLKQAIQLRIELRKLAADAEIAGSEIRRCCTGAWTDKFALRMLQNGKNANDQLQHYFNVLEARRQKIILRMNTISATLLDMGAPFDPADRGAVQNRIGQSKPVDIDSGKNANGATLFRDFCIRRFADLSNEELCKRLDLELSLTVPPLGLPKAWGKYNVHTYTEAYKNPKTKNNFQKMVAKAKGDF